MYYKIIGRLNYNYTNKNTAENTKRGKAMTVYGYARVSTVKQRIERQIDNIKAQFPDAIIVSEKYTGTTVDRPSWNKLKANLKKGDTVIFDEVSRMSRNAEEGFRLYEELFDKGINLIFLKERHLDTDNFRRQLERRIDLNVETGSQSMDNYINGQEHLINELMMGIAKEQIEWAFKTAQAEVDFLHQRTSEGVKKAQMEGKIVGRKQGAVIETKKAKETKQIILKHSKTFNGSLNDEEVMKLTGLSRVTYYKYKRQLKEQA